MRNAENDDTRTSASINRSIRRKPQAVRKRRGFWSANPIVVLWGTMVGKKVVMAVTGVILVGFVIAHMVGNIKIFIGEEVFDAYAAFLRDDGRAAAALRVRSCGWPASSCSSASCCTSWPPSSSRCMNRAARPQGYETKKSIAATVASLDHALERRAPGRVHRLPPAASDGWVSSVSSPVEFQHLEVYNNVVAGFSVWYVSLFYIVAMAALCLHLDHGVWSMLQTLGLNNARSSPVLRMMSRGVAILVFAGFISVPVAVLAGWIR